MLTLRECLNDIPDKDRLISINPVLYSETTKAKLNIIAFPDYQGKLTEINTEELDLDAEVIKFENVCIDGILWTEVFIREFVTVEGSHDET